VHTVYDGVMMHAL